MLQLGLTRYEMELGFGEQSCKLGEGTRNTHDITNTCMHQLGFTSNQNGPPKMN